MGKDMQPSPVRQRPPEEAARIAEVEQKLCDPEVIRIVKAAAAKGAQYQPK